MLNEFKRLKEIVQLLPKVMKNPEKVVEGWVADMKLENGELGEEETLEILKRRAICNGCPLLSINVIQNNEEYKRLYNKELETSRKVPFCSCCGCPIAKLTASLTSECGLDHYNLEHPDNKQRIKWGVYKPTNK